jgi:hypothetical protein
MKRKLSFILLIASLVFLISLVSTAVPPTYANEPDAVTEVRGIISEDTVWTKENSPYFLTGNVELAYGASLTIEPGVSVVGRWGSIEVWGDLIVEGTEDENVLFNNVRIEPLGKYSELSSIDMKHAHMYRGGVMAWNNSSPRTSFTIVDSIFQDTYYMNLYYPKAVSYLERNIFSDTGGIKIGTDFNQAIEIRNNLFYKTYGNYLIESMVAVSDKTIFEKNSFIDTPKVFNLTSTSFAFDLDARNNYWGTSEPDNFAAKFYDKNDSLSSPGFVLYEPYLTVPDPATPSLEDIPPIPPTVKNSEEFHDGMDMLAGTGEKGTTIYIKNGEEVLGEGIADAEGDFTLSFTPQPAGSLLQLYAKGENGKQSMEVPLVVQESPSYPPAMPSIVGPEKVTEETTSLTGKSDPRVTVFIRNQGDIIGETKTDLEGNYKIEFEPQPAWTEIELYAVSSKGISSQINTITIADITNPTVPVVNPVTNDDTHISGTAEPNSTVKVKIRGEERDIFVEGLADQDGYFEIPIEKQDPMVFIFVHAEDKAGNKSDETFLAVTDGVAPVWESDAPLIIEDVSYDFVAFSWPKAKDDVTSESKIRYRIFLNDLPYLDWPLELYGRPYYKMDVQENKEYTLKIIASDEYMNTSEPRTIKFKSLVRPWGFVDVELYEEEINYLTAKSIITGYPDHTFKPEQQIKRLQAVQMILREKGINVDEMDVKDPQFTDMKPGDYGYKEVAAAVELGFISGKTNPKTGQKYFDPWAYLTRAQMAKVLATAYEINTTIDREIFTDISHDFWGRKYVYALYSSGITTGYEDGTFKPNLPISRQHFSVFLARYLNEDF